MNPMPCKSIFNNSTIRPILHPIITASIHCLSTPSHFHSVSALLDMVQRVFFTRCTNKGMPCGMYERRKQQMYVETVTGYMNDRSPDFSRARRPESRLTLAPTTTSLPLKRNGVGRSPAPHQQRNMCRGRRPPHPRRSLIGVQMARTCGRFRSKWY